METLRDLTLEGQKQRASQEFNGIRYNIENVNKKEEGCWSPLAQAVDHGDIEAVRFFLDRGANTHSTDDRHSAILISLSRYSSRGVQPEIALLLFDHIGKVPTEEHNNILVAAAYAGDIQVVSKMLDAIPINPQSEGAHTALMAAAEEGDMDLLEFLLSRGADPNRVHRGETALDVAEYMVVQEVDETADDYDGRYFYGSVIEVLSPITKR